MRNLNIIILGCLLLISCDKRDSNNRRDRIINNISEKKIEDVDGEKTVNSGRVLIFTETGEWKVSFGDDNYYDEHSTYELYYNTNTNMYEWEFSGFKPKNHSVYKDKISKMIIDINNDVLEGASYDEIKVKYLNN